MASPKHKKPKTEGGSEGVPGPQGLPRAVPTLGDVAKDFPALHELLKPVLDKSVTTLGRDLRAELLLDQDKPTKLLLASFFGACDAQLEDAALKRGRVASEEEEAPELPRLNPLLLCPVQDVKVPPVDATAPPFTSEPRWLEETVGVIARHYERSDGEERVPPMALVRCSRGGKTRALKELARKLKERQIPVVMISLNDYSSLKAREKRDNVEAICCRIAFAASRDRNFEQSLKQFEAFRGQWKVAAEDIKTWLGDQSCVLLIDELNNVPQSDELAAFLKTNFVSRAKRYLVFSSHVLTTTGELSALMDSASSRQVILRELPLIPSLQVAARNLNWPSLSAREALYYGMVPALIHEAHLEAGEEGHLPSEKRDKAIRKCLNDGMVNEDSIRKLLGTFCSGYDYGVLPPLLQLMAARKIETRSVVEWIPFHMMEVLQEFSAEPGLQRLENIVQSFNAFKNAKESSRDGWQSLFVAVLLIRCWSQMSDHCILPFDIKETCTFSYNEPFDGNFATQEVAEFVKGIQPPSSFPHVAVYYPTHASFHLYDVIVARYDDGGVRKLYGYQLKEGKSLPKDVAMPEFEESFVIRGQAAQVPGMRKDWVHPSQDEIDGFFGVSGRHWTPRQWKKLSGM